MQFIATQMQPYVPATPSGSMQLISDPGWELLIEVFSSWVAGDSDSEHPGAIVTYTDDVIFSDSSSILHGVTLQLASQFTLLDSVQKEAVKAVFSNTNMTDSIVKTFEKVYVDNIAVQDAVSKEFSKFLQDSTSIQDSVSKEASIHHEENILLFGVWHKEAGKHWNDDLLQQDGQEKITYAQFEDFVNFMDSVAFAYTITSGTAGKAQIQGGATGTGHTTQQSTSDPEIYNGTPGHTQDYTATHPQQDTFTEGQHKEV